MTAGSNSVDKKALSERDICTKFITPALETAGWDVQVQVRENVYLTKRRVIARGKLVTRGTAKFADYVLYARPNSNVPLAIIEAKDNNHGIGDGMQQGLLYADMLDAPFVFASNGDAFLLHDRTGHGAAVERQLGLEEFPPPEELWRRYCAWKGLSPASEVIVTQSYYSDGTGKGPRYYQVNAINRVIEAVAKRQNRILLVMATGTGMTYLAFQIIWRLWKAVLRTTSVQRARFEPEHHKLLPTSLVPRPELQIEVGNVLVTRTGPTTRVGFACAVTVAPPRLMLSDKIIRIRVSADVDATFLALVLNAGRSQAHLKAVQSGMDLAQVNISRARLRSTPIPIPPLSVQKSIMAAVRRLLLVCDDLN